MTLMTLMTLITNDNTITHPAAQAVSNNNGDVIMTERMYISITQ